MNVSTPLGKLAASVAIGAAVAAVDALPTPLLDPAREYVAFVLTEDLDAGPWFAGAKAAYDGFWNDLDWLSVPTANGTP